MLSSWSDDEDDEETGVEDYGSGGKDACLFLIDATEKMHEEMEDAGENEGESISPYTMSLKCAHATIKNKVLHSPNDLLGVLLYGTKKKVSKRRHIFNANLIILLIYRLGLRPENSAVFLCSFLWTTQRHRA